MKLLKLVKFDDTVLTFVWGNNTLLRFPVLKPGETFSILEKTNHNYKKGFICAGSIF